MTIQENTTKNPTNQKNLYILAFSIVVIMLGFGIVMPIFPFYVDQFGAGGFELGLLMACYALMNLIFSPYWGRLSDRIGRKPVLMLGVLGFGISMILFGLATKLWMLFTARILSGILSSATTPTAMAYISDNTSEEERGGGMGVLGAAGGLGMILGPGLGGWLGSESLATPFFVAGGICFLSLGLIFLFLPEPQRVQTQQPVTKTQSVPKQSSIKSIIISPLGTLLILSLLISIGITIFYGAFGLYALEKYGYDTEQVGGILTVVGIASAVAQGVLAGPLTKRWGETAVIKAALLCSSIGFLMMSLASGGLATFIAIGFFFLATSLTIPAATALTSKLAAVDQGVAMGLSNSFMSAGRIIGPIWGGFCFDLNIEFPYLSGSLLFIIVFISSLFWVHPPKQTSQVAVPPGD